jgi:hypothetical protein
VPAALADHVRSPSPMADDVNLAIGVVSATAQMCTTSASWGDDGNRARSADEMMKGSFEVPPQFSPFKRGGSCHPIQGIKFGFETTNDFLIAVAVGHQNLPVRPRLNGHCKHGMGRCSCHPRNIIPTDPFSSPEACHNQTDPLPDGMAR